MQTLEGATAQAGLKAEVIDHILDILQIAFPIWLAEPAVDHRRVERPNGDGNYIISIESYRDSRTLLNFRQKIDALEILQSFDQFLKIKQPELFMMFSTPYGSRRALRGVELITHWCDVIFEAVKDGQDITQAIKQLIADLDCLLKIGTSTLKVMAPLIGLKLPDEVNQIDLAENIYIRRFDEKEIAEISSRNIEVDFLPQIAAHTTEVAIFINFPIIITYQEGGSSDENGYLVQQEIDNQLNIIVRSLHLLKEGRVSIVGTYLSYAPKVVPALSESVFSRSLVINPLGSMKLNTNEIESLISIYRRMNLAQRDEIYVASSRLVDAEFRTSSVDSLIDSIIGLETLLNPMDRDELSFRIALNYAFLGAEETRRSRYDAIRDIQKTRNKLVHGGAKKIAKKETETIGQHAKLGKACLRDTINLFLNDPILSSSKTLDVDFWLDKVIPSTADVKN